MNDGPGRPGHERCGGRTRSGRPCKLPAGHGTDHPGIGRCDHHGGATPTHQVHARRVAAERAVAVFGLPVVTTPEQALVDEVNRANGHVQWLAARVAELDPAELVWGERKRTTREASDGEREVTAEFGAGINTWVVLYAQERRHLAEVAKAAITCAAETVLADSARQLGQRMADVLDRAFAAAGMGWEQRDLVLGRFAAELGALETAPDPRPDGDGAV